MAARPEAQKPHELALRDRTQLKLTGVEEVLRADEDALLLVTSQGRLTVEGAGLRILRFVQGTGELEAEGRVEALTYGTQTGFWARLFG